MSGPHLCLHANLLQFLPFLEARHSFLNQEKRDSMSSRFCFRVCNRDNDDHIAHVTVGDENFAAIQNPIITVFLRIRSNSLQITAKNNADLCKFMQIYQSLYGKPKSPSSAWLCHGDRSDALARHHGRNELLNLLWRSVMSQIWHHDIRMQSKPWS